MHYSEFPEKRKISWDFLNFDFDVLFLPDFLEFVVDCFTISSNFVWKFSFRLPLPVLKDQEY